MQAWRGPGNDLGEVEGRLRTAEHCLQHPWCTSVPLSPPDLTALWWTEETQKVHMPPAHLPSGHSGMLDCTLGPFWMELNEENPGGTMGIIFPPLMAPKLALPFACSKTSSRYLFLKVKWMKIHRKVWFTWVNAFFKLYCNHNNTNYKKKRISRVTPC